MTTKVLSVRLETELYTKCKHQDLEFRELITKALNQYFRGKEPNKKLPDEPYTNVYTKEYVDLLLSTIEDLRRDKTYLESQNNALLVTKTPLLQRIVYRLKSKND